MNIFSCAYSRTTLRFYAGAGINLLDCCGVAHWLNYWTPVLGPPWSIPFEFPLFQWIVALLARMGVGLDPAGRCISWAFGVLALLPLSRISTYFDIDPWIVGCLYLASPLYLFWGSAFLIDTCALFFAASFLAYGLEDKWILCLLSGVLTALVKLPTLAPFAAVLLFLLWCTALVAGAIWTALDRYR